MKRTFTVFACAPHETSRSMYWKFACSTRSDKSENQISWRHFEPKTWIVNRIFCFLNTASRIELIFYCGSRLFSTGYSPRRNTRIVRIFLQSIQSDRPKEKAAHERWRERERERTARIPNLSHVEIANVSAFLLVFIFRSQRWICVAKATKS